jgi:hypothetical protein
MYGPAPGFTPAFIRLSAARLTDPAKIHQARVDYDFALSEVKRAYPRALTARDKFVDSLYDRYDAIDLTTRSWGDFLSEEDWDAYCRCNDNLKDLHQAIYEADNPPPHIQPAPVADTPSSHNLVLAWTVTILVAVAGFAVFR